MRKSRFHHTLPNFPLHIEKNLVNSIADLVHEQWFEIGNNAIDDLNIQTNIKDYLPMKIPKIYHVLKSYMKISLIS